MGDCHSFGSDQVREFAQNIQDCLPEALAVFRGDLHCALQLLRRHSPIWAIRFDGNRRHEAGESMVRMIGYVIDRYCEGSAYDKTLAQAKESEKTRNSLGLYPLSPNGYAGSIDDILRVLEETPSDPRNELGTIMFHSDGRITLSVYEAGPGHDQPPIAVSVTLSSI